MYTRNESRRPRIDHDGNMGYPLFSLKIKERQFQIK
jgi:hypothetical protein